MHISSSYAKILGETNFHTREIPRSGSKAKDGEKIGERKKKRLNDGNNNGQATHGARKPPGPKQRRPGNKSVNKLGPDQTKQHKKEKETILKRHHEK